MRRLLWILFGLVDAAVLGAAAAGFLAAYVDPRAFWWGQMAAVALPVLMAALLGLALVPALRRRWRLAALHAVLLGLFVLREAPFERLGARAEPAEDDLVLMTLNVPRHGPSAEALAAEVTALMAAEAPHLVGLQGTGARRAPEPPYRARAANYVQPALDSLGYRLAIPPEAQTGQPVLVRRGAPGGLAVLEQSQRVLAVGPGDYGASRYVRTRLRWQGREAVHYNVHLRHFGTEKPWEHGLRALRPSTWPPFLRRYRRAFQLRAREVDLLAEEIGRERLPVIISGDFNATPYNWAYRRLVRGRTDAFRRAGTGRGATYHAELPLVRIDHALLDPAFEVVSARVPEATLSDHRPLVVRLRWRKAAGEKDER